MAEEIKAGCARPTGGPSGEPAKKIRQLFTTKNAAKKSRGSVRERLFRRIQNGIPGDSFQDRANISPPARWEMAVWPPCCTSGIVFPLLFSPAPRPAASGPFGPGKGRIID